MTPTIDHGSAANYAITLDRAADELQRRGLYKGWFQDRLASDHANCKVCALGALRAAVFNDPDPGRDNGQVYLSPEHRFVVRIEDILDEAVTEMHVLDAAGDRVECTADYNDLDDTTAEDVISLFRTTAAKLRAA